MSHHYGLILAGGRGTRFWPRSRRNRAKQVLRFFGERSLIQQTVDRLRPVLPPERIWILTNEHLRAEIVDQLPEVPKRQILAEPAARNTAPAIGLAAHILQSIDPDAIMGVFPADHVIGKSKEYANLLRPAFRAAANGEMVVLGIEPRWAETGYGYIEFPPDVQAGAHSTVRVLSFREKPDAATAANFLAAKTFYWNAGMFFWQTSVVLDALRRFLPKTAALLASLPAGAASLPRNSRKAFRSATTSRSTTRCSSARRTSPAFRPATSAGATSEAGTPSTSCKNAMRKAMRCAPMRWLRAALGITWMRRAS
jgi:mannose-1-phosphate guanylyltransferase